MRYEDNNLNEVIISGVINAITDTNDKYIKFGNYKEIYYKGR